MVFGLWLVGLLGSLSITFYLVRGVILKTCIKSLNTKAEELETLYKKTQLKINQLRNEFGEPESMVAEGLQGLDLQTILPALMGNLNPEMLKGLGLPAWLLPVAQGFLKKMGEKNQGGGNVASSGHPHQ